MAIAVFVELNGYHLEATEHEVVRVTPAVADRRCSEKDPAKWVRAGLLKK